jgi:hypothetical protein
VTINQRIEAGRRERRVLTRVSRAAWRLEQAERERDSSPHDVDDVFGTHRYYRRSGYSVTCYRRSGISDQKFPRTTGTPINVDIEAELAKLDVGGWRPLRPAQLPELGL